MLHFYKHFCGSWNSPSKIRQEATWLQVSDTEPEIDPLHDLFNWLLGGIRSSLWSGLQTFLLILLLIYIIGMMFKLLILCHLKYLFPRTRSKQPLKHNPDGRNLQQGAKQVVTKPQIYFVPSDHHNDHYGLWRKYIRAHLLFFVLYRGTFFWSAATSTIAVVSLIEHPEFPL